MYTDTQMYKVLCARHFCFEQKKNIQKRQEKKRKYKYDKKQIMTCYAGSFSLHRFLRLLMFKKWLHAKINKIRKI